MACNGDTFTLPGLNQSLSFLKTQSIFSVLVFFVVRMCTLFKYDVITLIELVESRTCLWDKTADCFKDTTKKQKAWREVYVFLEEEFLDKDKKEQQNTVCHTIYQKIKSVYAHAEVIIKFGVRFLSLLKRV